MTFDKTLKNLTLAAALLALAACNSRRRRWWRAEFRAERVGGA